MPTLTYTQQNLPASGQVLREHMEAAYESQTAVDDFVLIIQELTKLEVKHDMPSPQFYQQFQAGEMGDGMEQMRWANKYEIYQEMHAEMAGLFETLTHYALPVAA